MQHHFASETTFHMPQEEAAGDEWTGAKVKQTCESLSGPFIC